MPTRAIAVDGREWRVFPSGRVTQMDKDEFGIMFVAGGGAGTGDAREVRVTRYSPQGARSREQSIAEMTDDALRQLFAVSQPSFTSPEAGYAP